MEKEVFIYGFNHYEISTEEAKEILMTNCWKNTELFWWKVLELADGSEVYEDNCLGCILIIGKGDISYIREF